MSVRTEPWPAGVPCWIDLTVPDVGAAKAFYAEALGWTYADTEGDFGGYAIAEMRAVAVAGIGPLPAAGMTPAWTLYFASVDADVTSAAVAEHGGTVLLPPGDVDELGRMCIAADPTGAAFGVWQAGTHIGACLVNEPGGLVWEDLRSPDPATAQAFYRAVFGYDTEAVDAAGPDYVTFALPGRRCPSVAWAR